MMQHYTSDRFTGACKNKIHKQVYLGMICRGLDCCSVSAFDAMMLRAGCNAELWMYMSFGMPLEAKLAPCLKRDVFYQNPL
jgi:hypothetical protein